jgi:hypothetical protein
MKHCCLETTNKKHAEGDKRSSDVNTIPCSLTGRMRKPNQQYSDYFIAVEVNHLGF